MKQEPNGLALLDTLVRLLAEQEGVTITYEVKIDREGHEKE